MNILDKYFPAILFLIQFYKIKINRKTKLSIIPPCYYYKYFLTLVKAFLKQRLRIYSYIYDVELICRFFVTLYWTTLKKNPLWPTSARSPYYGFIFLIILLHIDKFLFYNGVPCCAANGVLSEVPYRVSNRVVN